MMNGALTLSRLLDDKILSDKVLKEARDFILTLATEKANLQGKSKQAARN